MSTISLDKAIEGFVKVATMAEKARSRFESIATANLESIARSLREQGFSDDEVEEALTVCREENDAALRDLTRKIWTDGMRFLIESTGAMRITITAESAT